ncbi:hypothetical protein J6590_042146 [Homalodisca vitripennis]|nr:hypothetical protein J6590_042146 [Homalodisca vitripennis]
MAAAASTTQTVTGESTNTETGVISVPPHALDWPIAAANSTTQHNSDCPWPRPPPKHNTTVTGESTTLRPALSQCLPMLWISPWPRPPPKHNTTVTVLSHFLPMLWVSPWPRPPPQHNTTVTVTCLAAIHSQTERRSRSTVVHSKDRTEKKRKTQYTARQNVAVAIRSCVVRTGLKRRGRRYVLLCLAAIHSQTERRSRNTVLRSKDRTEKKSEAQYTARQNVAVAIRSCVVRTGQKRRGRRYVLLCLAAIHSQTERRSRSTVLRSKDRTEKKRKTQQYTARQNVAVTVRSCVVRTEQKRRGRRYVLLCLAAIHSQTERRSRSTVVRSKDRTEETRKAQYTARQNVAVAIRSCVVRTEQKRRGRRYVLLCLAAIHSQTERRSRSTVVRSKDRTEKKRKTQYTARQNVAVAVRSCVVRTGQKRRGRRYVLLCSAAIHSQAERRSHSTVLRSKDRKEEEDGMFCYVWQQYTARQNVAVAVRWCAVRTGQKRRGRRYVLLCLAAIHSQAERCSDGTVLRSKDRTEKKRKTQYTARQNVAVTVRSCVVRTGQKRRGRRYVLLCLAAIHSQTERRSRSTVLRSKDRSEKKRKTQQYTARQNVAVTVRSCVVRTGQKRRGRRYVLLCLAAIHSQTERCSDSTVLRSKDSTEKKRKTTERCSDSTTLRSKDRKEEEDGMFCYVWQQYTARQNVAVAVRWCAVRTGQKRRGRRYVLLCLAAIHSQAERCSDGTVLRSKDRTEKKRKTQYTARQNVAVTVRSCVVRTGQKRRGRRYVLLCLAAIHSQTERRSRSTVLRSKDRSEKKRKTQQYTARQNVAVTVRSCVVRTGQKRRGRRYVLLCLAAIHSQTERCSDSTVLRSKDSTEKKRKTQYTARQNVAVALRWCAVRTGQKRRGRRYVLLCLAAIHSQAERCSDSTVLRSKDRTEKKRKTQYTARQNVAVTVRPCVVRTGQKRRGRRYVLLCLAAIHSQTELRSRNTVMRSKDRTEKKRKTQYTARQNVAVTVRPCVVRTGQKRRGRRYVLLCLAAIHSQTERRSRNTVLRSKDRTEKKREAQYTARQNVAVAIRSCVVRTGLKRRGRRYVLLCLAAIHSQTERRSRNTVLRSKDRTEKKRKTQQYTARQNVAVTVRSCVVRTGQKRRGRRYVLLCLAAIHSQTERRRRSTVVRSKDRTEEKRKAQYTARQNVAVTVRPCVVRTGQKRRGRRYVLLCLAAIHSQTELRSRNTVMRSKDRTEKKRKTQYTARQNVAVTVRPCVVRTGQKRRGRRYVLLCLAAIHSQTERRSRNTVLRSKDRTEKKREAQYTARQNVAVAIRSCVVRTGLKRRGRRYVLLCLAAIHSQTERRSRNTVLRSKDRTEKKRKTQYTARQNVAVTVRSCVVRTGQKRRGRRYVLLCLAAIHSQTERRRRSTVVRSKDRTEEKRKAQYTARQNVAVTVRSCVVRTGQKRRGRRYVLLCLAAIHSQTERCSDSTTLRSKDRTEKKRKTQYTARQNFAVAIRSCVVRTGLKRRGRRYVLLCLAAIHSQTELRSRNTALRSKDRTEKKRKTQYTARQNVAVAIRSCVVRTGLKRRGRRYVLLCLAAIHSQTERRSRNTVLRSKDRTEKKRKTVCFVMFGSNTQPDRTSQSQYGPA